jgi:O-antigen biosynthesis protein
LHGHVTHALVIHAVIVCHPHIIRAAAAPLVRFVNAALALVLPKRKISVVTPTWKRRELLTGRCIPSVRAQTYTGPVEHVIVSDGPDPDLAGVRCSVLTEHRTAPNRGIWARRYGTEIATGDLIGYLDDDNAWKPYHLELLAGMLEETGADFAYSKARCVEPNGLGWTIGCDPPQFAQIDTSLIVHRRELLSLAQWEPSLVPADWDLVARWMNGGATWVHVPVVTLDYYVRSPAAMIR